MGNELMKSIVAKGAHGAQKGFLPKRRFAMQDDLANADPLMVLCDFGDAFPSMCRTWLNLALKKADFPEGTRN
eukprot:206175-Pyramimonas_sp.AAC.1